MSWHDRLDWQVWDPFSLEEILSNVDVEVPEGARAVIVGPNGCGKTTLLTTIANRDSVEGTPLGLSHTSSVDLLLFRLLLLYLFVFF